MADRFSYRFCHPNQLVTVTAPNGKVTKYAYDAAGRMVKEGAKSYRYGYLDKVFSVTEGKTVNCKPNESIFLRGFLMLLAGKYLRFGFDSNLSFMISYDATERNVLSALLDSREIAYN